MASPSPVYGCTYDLPKEWDDPTWNPYVDPEPLPTVIVQVARLCDIDPRDLDWHTEAVHGWEPHDRGYDGQVVNAARCIVNGTAADC